MFTTIHKRDRGERTTVNNDILEWCLWLSGGIPFLIQKTKRVWFCFVLSIAFLGGEVLCISSFSVVSYMLFYDTYYLHWQCQGRYFFFLSLRPCIVLHMSFPVCSPLSLGVGKPK